MLIFIFLWSKLFTQKVDIMDNFIKNLKTLASVYTQKKIAQDTSFSPSSIANYLSGASQPSAQFLLELKKAYCIDIDEFLVGEINSEAITKNVDKSYNKFIGDYIVYYYNSSAYKGKVGSYNYDILTYGIISIVNETDNKTSKGVKAYGIFMLKRDEAEKYLKKLNDFNSDTKKISEFYSQFENYYNGNLEQNSTQFFISLTNGNDRCLTILNNPPSLKKYIGGLGTVNSISRGREHVPCVQYILLSKLALTIPDGELYNLLALGLSEVNVKNEVNDLITLIKNLYISQSESGLNDYQKRRIVEDSISNIIFQVVDANIFRFAKVSNMEDDNYYRLIKDSDND